MKDGAEGAFDSQAGVFPVGNPVQPPVEAPDIEDDPDSQTPEEDGESHPEERAGDKVIHGLFLPTAGRRD